MDSQDYLDQISRSARPPKQKQGGLGDILKSKWFKWGMIAFGLLLVIMLFGAMLSGGESMEDRCIELKLHLDTTADTISEYQDDIKSSLLRSLASSLKGVFTNTSSQINTYLEQQYGFDDKHITKEQEEAAELARDELMNNLFEAKINGILDRVFAHKMALVIYGTMGTEAGLSKDSSDEALKSLISTSYDSLNNLYTQFNDFSETKVK